MEENKIGYLTDDEGNPSTMRVMSWCSFLIACVVGILLIVRTPADTFTGLYVFTAFLVGGFVPKAIQKFAEQPLSMKK
jgi:hypothetical protein